MSESIETGRRGQGQLALAEPSGAATSDVNMTRKMGVGEEEGEGEGEADSDAATTACSLLRGAHAHTQSIVTFTN